MQREIKEAALYPLFLGFCCHSIFFFLNVQHPKVNLKLGSGGHFKTFNCFTTVSLEKLVSASTKNSDKIIACS